MNLAEINRRVQEPGPTPAEAISLSVWVAVSFPGSGKDLFLTPLLWVIHDLGILGLSWRRDTQICNLNKRQSAYVRPCRSFDCITDFKSKLQVWLSHRHCLSLSRTCSLLSSPLGHPWWLSRGRVCLVCSKCSILAAGMGLLHLHPWPCVLLPPPLHPMQVLWARSVQSSTANPHIIHQR